MTKDDARLKSRRQRRIDNNERPKSETTMQLRWKREEYRKMMRDQIEESLMTKDDV